jgi:hypothetical protein
MALAQRPWWHRHAACRGQGTGQWFPEQGVNPEARAICAGRAVADECLAAGARERHGLWGGASTQQRKQARRAVP